MIVEDRTATLGADVLAKEAFADDSAPHLPACVVLIPPQTRSAFPSFSDVASGTDPIAVALPVRVQQATFERLVDLRLPHVALWFARNLTRLRWLTSSGERQPAFPGKGSVNEFVQLLPSLMVQAQGGGNGASRIAGQWLRTLGADGLIFPSARSDCRVEIEQGHLLESYGWNLVDEVQRQCASCRST